MMADKGIPLQDLSPQTVQAASEPARATTPTKRTLDFNRLYFSSFAGVSSIVAMILGFISMLILEGHLSSRDNSPPSVSSWRRDKWQIVFLEISTLLSWLFQFLFIILTGILSVQNVLGLKEKAMNFFVIGHSTFWFGCVLTSCLLTALATDYTPVAISAVFGFFECFVLLVTAFFATLQAKGGFEDPSFE